VEALGEAIPGWIVIWLVAPNVNLNAEGEDSYGSHSSSSRPCHSRAESSEFETTSPYHTTINHDLFPDRERGSIPHTLSHT
jgi:hypothetical protein